MGVGEAMGVALGVAGRVGAIVGSGGVLNDGGREHPPAPEGRMEGARGHGTACFDSTTGTAHGVGGTGVRKMLSGGLRGSGWTRDVCSRCILPPKHLFTSRVNNKKTIQEER